MNVTLVLAFWGVAFLLIVVPGPDWAFVLACGLRDQTVAAAVGRLMLGYVLLTVIVAAGVGAIVTDAPAVLTALTVIGAGYLVYLGAFLLAEPSVISSGPPSEDPPARWETVPPSERPSCSPAACSTRFSAPAPARSCAPGPLSRESSPDSRVRP